MTFCGVPFYYNKMFESEEKSKVPDDISFVQKVVDADSDKAQFCKKNARLNHDDMFLISRKGQNIWF